MPKLFFYNTLTRKKDQFEPISEKLINIYTCGPTVYNYAHIGNLRAYIFSDILARALRYNYGEEKIRWAMNITDVDDKTIRDSKKEFPELNPAEALPKLTAKFEEIFWSDMAKLNIKKPDAIPHAADEKYIKAQQDLVTKIYNAGFAYIKDGSVYFNLAKYVQEHNYGKLSNIDMDAFKPGARVDADEYEKENVQDFVLWKGTKPGEPFWVYELNRETLPGRPGWHIECSAMGEMDLGMPFDIHTGGIDLKFPHHENEIAQSVIGYGVERPVNYWLHNEFLQVDGAKMSKRFKNFYTLRDVEEKGYKPLAFRYLCMLTGYGKQMNFTWTSLKAAEEGLNHLHSQVRELGDESGVVNDEFKNKFLESINDDLNTPQALSIVQELLKSDLTNEDKLATVLDFDKVLGLNLHKAIGQSELPANVAELAEARKQARIDKKFAESDKLRIEIEKLGYVVEDTKDGQRVYKK